MLYNEKNLSRVLVSLYWHNKVKKNSRNFDPVSKFSDGEVISLVCAHEP